MKSIDEEIIEIKNNLTQIKTTQFMQNDSNTIYTYRTNNLFFSSGATRYYRIEFEPYDKSRTTLCQINFQGASSMIQGSADSDNPLVGYCQVVQNTSGVTFDIFVWVFSNKAGIIKLTQIS